MQVLEVAVKDRQGLHARACARLVRVANQFRCDIALIARGRRASARSIIAVMLLAASVGSTIRVEADGPDEASAVSEIAALFDAGPGGPA